MSKKKETPAVQAPTKEKLSLDNDYPELNGFKYAIGYLEQALNIASEPLLAACFVIAVIDVMTALHLNRYGTSITLAILGVLLGIVDCAALAIKRLQQMLNIPFAQALTWLYLNPVLMVYIRSIVAVSILVVVALSNHLAITTAQAPKRRLTLWDKALNKLAPVVSSDQTPTAQPVSTPDTEQEVKQVAPKQSARLRIVEMNTDENPLERVRQVLSEKPDCSDRRFRNAYRFSTCHC